MWLKEQGEIGKAVPALSKIQVFVVRRDEKGPREALKECRNECAYLLGVRLSLVILTST
jgi:hypothetical protein